MAAREGRRKTNSAIIETDGTSNDDVDFLDRVTGEEGGRRVMCTTRKEEKISSDHAHMHHKRGQEKWRTDSQNSTGSN